MRKGFLIFTVFFLFCLTSYSQADVKIDCSSQWGPGRYNKVSVSISFRVYGFARFTQNFPVGFSVASGNCDGCDLNWTGNQVNVVFMDIRPGKPYTFSYYIMPEKNMTGTFSIQGEVIVIADGKTRFVLPLIDKDVEISGSGGLLPEEMKGNILTTGTRTTTTGYSDTETEHDRIQYTGFRIQVSATTKVIPEDKLRKEFSLEPDLKIYIVKAGATIKYQAGDFKNYDSAQKMLEKLKAAGVRGAFIVSYVNGVQAYPAKTIIKK